MIFSREVFLGIFFLTLTNFKKSIGGSESNRCCGPGFCPTTLADAIVLSCIIAVVVCKSVHGVRVCVVVVLLSVLRL
jgi:hypothetical protein